MELVDGLTLADRIATSPIPYEEALPMAKGMTEALEAAHEQGIVHRDLKPSNVMVRTDGTADPHIAGDDGQRRHLGYGCLWRLSRRRGERRIAARTSGHSGPRCSKC
jgi:serine/threonine protein kinase